jgi:chemotaxis protein MotB
MIDKGSPIIVKKRKARAHGGAHGGAWKVAYADFVTAMMAFFLVMWLVTQSKEVKAAVGNYFRDPGIFDQQKSNGPIEGGETRLDPDGPLSSKRAKTDEAVLEEERKVLEKTAERIKTLLSASPDLKKLEKQIEIQVTREGLRIELLEGDRPTFFASGSAELAPVTRTVLGLISVELGKLKNTVLLEGHTDSRPYSSTTGYSNWELSADRANAARRAMELHGLWGGQVRGIRGYADTVPRIANQPMDARNRRVSVVVRNIWRENELPPALRTNDSGPARGTTENTGAVGSRTQ